MSLVFMLCMCYGVSSLLLCGDFWIIWLSVLLVWFFRIWIGVYWVRRIYELWIGFD